MNTFEFEITIQRKYEDNWPVVVTIRQPGDGLRNHAEGTFQLSDEQFRELDKLKLQLRTHRKYGTLLGKALFQGEVLRCFERTFAKSNYCGDSFRLLLSITADDDKLRTLHWEWLCAPIDDTSIEDDEWELLSCNERILFSQYIPTIIERRFPSIGRRNLRALILVASPLNVEKDYELANFDVERTISGLKKVLGDIDCDVLAHDVEGAIGQPTLNELVKQLTNAQKPYTLLHIVCHGSWNEGDEDKDTVLYWTTADNQVDTVTGKQLIGRLKKVAHGLPYLTFFCACESAVPTANSKVKAEFGGLAQMLVRKLGMPTVVGMTREVSIETALKLAENFYHRLREHGEVDKALREAITPLADQDDITVPALFSRLGGRPLFSDSDRLEEGRELNNEEIDNGIDKLRKLLGERAPKATVLNKRFNDQVETLRNIKGAESKEAQEERRRALYELNNICDQLLDGISFDALAALDKKPPEYKAKCPFPGLSSFGDEEYHEFFFGREELIKELQSKLEEDNFLAVIGSSGSGKSSVVLAGLIPKLCKEKSLKMEYLTPTDKPLQQLQKSLSAVSNQTVVFVVDQFEELFTLSSKKSDQKKFIKELLDLAQNHKVIITMRADFMGECISIDSKLKKRIQGRQILVAPMEPHELGIAMKMQAEEAKLKFEEGLSNAILSEVEGEPGAMPLLQYALRQLWERRQGKWLRYEEYEAIGGLKKAIAKTADEFFNGLNKDQKVLVQKIFLCLVRVDEEQGDTRRDTRKRVQMQDLPGSPETTKKLVNDLADKRLVIMNEGEVEVAHEALIRHWDQLQTWLKDNLQDLLLRQTIEKGAEEWTQDKKEEFLTLAHQEGRLKIAEELLSRRSDLFTKNGKEEEYVKACVELRDRQEQEKLEASLDVSITLSQLLFASNKKLDALVNLIKTGKNWQNELEKYEFSRLRFLVMLGYMFSELAEYNSINAYEYDEVTSLAWSPNNQIVASASSGGVIKIWSADGTFIEEINVNEGVIGDLTFSSDGKILASASSDRNYGTIQFWKMSISNTDTVTLLKYPRLEGHRDGVNSISFRPGDVNSNREDEIILASASQDGTVRLWSQKGTLVKTLEGHKYPVKCVAYSLDGKMIASGDSDGVVIIWSRDGNLLHRIDKESAGEQIHTKSVTSINFSPDGKILVSSGRDKLIKFWDMNGEFVDELYKQEREVMYVTFSLDGRLMASTDLEGNIKIWFENEKLWSQESKLLRALKHEKAVPKVSFSKDGKKLLSCSYDKTIRFWNYCSKFDGYDNGKFKGHTAWITSIKFNVADKTITTSSEDKTVKIWNYEGELLISHSNHDNETYSEVKSSQNGKFVAISHDDKMTATVEPNKKPYEIKLENCLDSKLKKGISSAKLPILGLKFSQCNKTIILISWDYIELWKSDDLSKEKSIQLNIEKNNGGICAASLSSDWSKIAVAYYEENDGYENNKINRIRLWNLDLKEALKEAEIYVQNYRI